MITLNLNPDHSVTWSDGTVTPAPQPQPVPSPQPNGDMQWEPFDTTHFFPLDQPGIQARGDQGFALAVFANTTKYPNGIILNYWDQTPQGIAKEVVISQTPHDFTIGTNNRMMGIQSGGRGIFFYTGSASQPGPSDAVVQGNAWFYLNMREYRAAGDTTPRTETVSAQFSAQER